MFKKTRIIAVSILLLSVILALVGCMFPESDNAQIEAASINGTGEKPATTVIMPIQKQAASKGITQKSSNVIAIQANPGAKDTEQMLPKADSKYEAITTSATVKPITKDIVSGKDKEPAKILGEEEERQFPELTEKYPEVSIPRPVKPGKLKDKIKFPEDGEIPEGPIDLEPNPDKELPDVSIPRPVNPDDERIEFPEVPEIPEDVEGKYPDIEEIIPDVGIPKPVHPGLDNEEDEYFEKEPEKVEFELEPEAPSDPPVELIKPEYSVNPIVHGEIDTAECEI